MSTNTNLARRISGFAVRGLMALAVLGAGASQAADTTKVATAKVAAKQSALTPVDDIDTRIKRLHDQLHITAEEEVLWAPVATVMHDNARVLSDAMTARMAKAPTMNAVDDLTSYAGMARAHADGLQKLATAFGPLYAAMPPAQQQEANAVFAVKATPSPRKS